MNSTHVCDAIVVSCIDFRFQKYIRDWLNKNLTYETFDYVGFAGGTKDLDIILHQIDISVRLHHIKKVILMHHENCGAYGEESTLERHSADLIKAKQAILAKYSDLQVALYYVHLDGTFQPIDQTVLV